MRKIRGRRAVALGTRAVVCGLVVAAGLVIPTWAPAVAEEQTAPQIVRVEEDWGILLNEPNDLVNAPQYHVVMSPFGHVDDVYFQTTWNYWELPRFTDGGVQMQAWQGDYCIYDQDFAGQQLSNVAEMVIWTQSLETNGEQVFFGIDNGFSSTWGTFGGESMKIHADRHVSSLNGYSTDVSVENSWITYGVNRVNALVLFSVRYYGADGSLLAEDTTTRVVYRDEAYHN